MKKLLILLTLVFGFLFFAVPSEAASPSIVDDAGLFTTEEINNLNDLAQTLNEQIKGEVFIYTTNTSYGDAETFTDDFLRDRVGNNNNGAVLMINMNYRDYHFSTSGNMIDYLTDSRFDTIEERVVEALSNDQYYQAAAAFLVLSSEYVSEGIPNEHYRIDRDTGEITYYNVLTLFELTLALAAAAIISLGFFFFIKSRYQLKSGTYRYPYAQKSSLKLQRKEDRLTNSFIRTRRIPRNTGGGGGGGRSGGGSTTHSSGGGTFGGRGGKF